MSNMKRQIFINFLVSFLVLVNCNSGFSKKYVQFHTPFGSVLERDQGSPNYATEDELENIFTKYVLTCGLQKRSLNNTDWYSINHYFSGRCKSGLKSTSIVRKNNLYFLSTDSNGIFRSSNGGEKWFHDSSSVFNSVCSLVIVEDSIFAGTTNGVFKALVSDSIKTWIRVGNYASQINCLVFRDNIIYAGTNINGVIKKNLTDTNDWSNLPSNLDNGKILSLCIGENSGYLYASRNSYGIYKFDGNSVSLVNNEPRCLCITSYQSKIACGLSSDRILYNSDDSGNNWIEIDLDPGSSPNNPTDIQCLSFIYLNSELFLFTGQYCNTAISRCGLFSSAAPNFTQWTRVNIRSEDKHPNYLNTFSFIAKIDTNIFLGLKGTNFYPSAQLYTYKQRESDPVVIDKYLFKGLYDCHTYAWHLVEGGKELFVTGSNMGDEYIGKPYFYTKDSSYILATSSDFSKVTYNTKMNYIAYDSLFQHSATFYSGDTVVSKWNTDGPLIKHRINDISYYDSSKYSVYYWKNKISIGGQKSGALNYKISKTIESTQKLLSGANVTYQIAPLNNACIVLDTGFNALPGSKFQAYVSGHHPSDETIIYERENLFPLSNDSLEQIVKTNYFKKESAEDFICFPNPTKDCLTFKSNKKSTNNEINLSLKVYSLDGKIICNQQFLTKEEQFNIDVSSFPSGLYFFELYSFYNSNSNNITVKCIQIIK